MSMFIALTTTYLQVITLHPFAIDANIGSTYTVLYPLPVSVIIIAFMSLYVALLHMYFGRCGGLCS